MLFRRLLLVAALILGSVGGATYLNSLRDLVPVVFTTARVDAHTPLSPDLLTIRRINREAAQTIAPDAIGRLEDAVGLVTRVTLNKGEVVRRDPTRLVTLPKGADLALPRHRIPAGMRLVGLKVDSPGAVAGSVNPGDQVDVVFSGRENGTAYSRTLMQGVEVFSLKKQGGSGPLPLPDSAGGLEMTLLVTPDQAQLLALAKRSGGHIDLSIAPPDSTPAPLADAVVVMPPL